MVLRVLILLAPISYPRPKHRDQIESQCQIRLPLTLKVSRDLTLSCSTSAMARSKLARIFMASWGSMRVSVIRSSRVSVSVAPMLFQRKERNVYG